MKTQFLTIFLLVIVLNAKCQDSKNIQKSNINSADQLYIASRGELGSKIDSIWNKNDVKC